MQETRAEIARDPSPSGPEPAPSASEGGHLPHVMGEEFEKRSAALCCTISSYAIALPLRRRDLRNATPSPIFSQPLKWRAPSEDSVGLSCQISITRFQTRA